MISSLFLISLIIFLIFILLILHSKMNAKCLSYQYENQKLQSIIDEKEKMIKVLNENIIQSVSNSSKIAIEPVLKELQDKISNTIIQTDANILNERAKIIQQNKEDIEKILKDVTEKINKIDKAEEFNKINIGTTSEILNKFIGIFDNSKKLGPLGEISLQTLLDGLGFQNNYSFFGQHSINGGRLDFIVHLPENRVMIIDSKTSQIFAEPKTNEKEWIDKLKTSIKSHISGLKSKEYNRKVQESLEQKNKTDHVLDCLVMYLPTDSCFEDVMKYCGEIVNEAYRDKIIICGPSGLVSILLVQKENRRIFEMKSDYTKNLEAMKALATRFLDIFYYIQNTGINIAKAMESYNKAAIAINRNVFQENRKVILSLGEENRLKDNKVDKMTTYNIEKNITGEVEDDKSILFHNEKFPVSE